MTDILITIGWLIFGIVCFYLGRFEERHCKRLIKADYDYEISPVVDHDVEASFRRGGAV